tara:strand:+ start:5002 stop:6312 length:1311 start_codon:yes stop_codon:yes gene_type:complete
MEIQHYSNSFLSIKSGKTKLVCDPWVGTTYENAWISDPLHFGGKKIINNINPKYIYISHLHCDHFDPILLKKINKKNTVVIIKKFKLPIIKNRIKKIGFNNILELEEWTVNRISTDISVAIIPQMTNNNEGIDSNIEYDLDTSILIKCHKTNKLFYNNVDNPIDLKHIKKIKKFVQEKMKSKIDICTFNIGAASEYPQCFLNIDRNNERDKIITRSMNKTIKKIKILGAGAFFPSGGSYKVSGKFFSLNKFVALPKEVTLQKLNNKNFKFFNLLGGQTLKINQDKFIVDEKKLNLTLKSNALEKIKYSYEKKKKPNLDKINNIFYKSLGNYYSRIKKYKIKQKWKINFLIFDKIELNKQAKINYHKSKVLKKYEIDFPNKGQTYYLDVFLDLKLFNNLLLKKSSWNTALSGSFVLFKRKPNKFIPDIPFSLNFLTI